MGQMMKTLFPILGIAILCGCQNKTDSLVGYRTTAEQPWEKVNFADTLSNNYIKVTIDFGLDLGSFHVQSAQPAQSIETAGVLLDMKGGIYDEPDGDLDMRYFNLAPDRERQIPHIREIIQENSSLCVGVLADNYPSWMNSTHLEEDVFQQAYSSFLLKYIELYQREGVCLKKVILPAQNIWGVSSNKFLSENLKKQNVELIQTDSLFSTEPQPDQPLKGIWKNFHQLLDAGLPLACIILNREDSPPQYFWKKQVLQHLSPFGGQSVTYLKSVENDNVVAFLLPTGKYLLLLCNSEKKGGVFTLSIHGKELKIQLAAESLNSVIIS